MVLALIVNSSLYPHSCLNTLVHCFCIYSKTFSSIHHFANYYVQLPNAHCFSGHATKVSATYHHASNCSIFPHTIFLIAFSLGGIVLNVMRDEFTRSSTEYVHLLPLYQKLVDQGQIRQIEQVVIPEKYLMGFDALIQVYQVV